MTPRGDETQPVLAVSQLSVEQQGRLILDDVSFELQAREFVCLCGPNGGGKTTLLRAVLGLIAPTRGRIVLLGRDPVSQRAKVGYLPQYKAFARDFPATPGELIVAALRGRWPFRLTPAERAKADDILRQVGASALIDQPLASLSGGETQRVYLARALVTEPVLLLLDEPTAGVDAPGQQALITLVGTLAAKWQTAVLLVTHHLASVAHLADRAIYLDHRLKLQGPAREILYQIEPTVAWHADHGPETGEACPHGPSA